MITQEQDSWLQATFKINVRHAEVETGGDGDLVRKRGSEYQGEEKQVGFRSFLEPVKDEEDLVLRQIGSKKEHLVTRMLKDDEVEKSTVSVGEDGKISTPEKGKIDGTVIYSVDSESDDMVAASEGLRIVEVATGKEHDPGRKMTFYEASSYAIRSKGKYRVETMHHSTLVQGGDVKGAGKITAKDGKITEVSNESGHYKPRLGHLLQTVERLIRDGALLQHDIVDSEGRDVKTEMPKAYELYTRLQPKIAGLEQTRARIGELTKAVDEGEKTGTDVGDIKSELANLEKGVDLVTKGIEALRKMGIGKSNRMSDANVEVTYASDQLNGKDFRLSSEKTTVSVSDFMMGTGSSKPEELEPEPLPETKDERERIEANSYTFTDDGQKLFGDGRVEVPNEREQAGLLPDVLDLPDIGDSSSDTVDQDGNIYRGGMIEEIDEPKSEPTNYLRSSTDEDDSNYSGYKPEGKKDGGSSAYVTTSKDEESGKKDDGSSPYVTASKDEDEENYKEYELRSEQEEEEDEDTGSLDGDDLGEEKSEATNYLRESHYKADNYGQEKTVSDPNSYLDSNYGQEKSVEDGQSAYLETAYSEDKGKGAYDRFEGLRGDLQSEQVAPSEPELQELTSYTLDGGEKKFIDPLAPKTEGKASPLGDGGSYTLDNGKKTFFDGRVEEEEDNEDDEDEDGQPPVNPVNASSYTLEGGQRKFGDGRVEEVAPLTEEEQERARLKLEDERRKAAALKNATRRAEGKTEMLKELREHAQDGDDIGLAKVGTRDIKQNDLPDEGAPLVDDKGTVDETGEEVEASLLKSRKDEDEYLEKLRKERMEELKTVGDENRKGLRPEDRGIAPEPDEWETGKTEEGEEVVALKAKKTVVSEGQAPEVDRAEWNKEVDELNEALKDLDK